MTRTISVIFDDDYRFEYCYKYPKIYKFLCNYDVVMVGDKIKDPRYTSSMTIVEIFNSNKRVQEGIILKEIYITHINGVIAIQPSGLINGVKFKSNFDNDIIKSKKKKNIWKIRIESIALLLKKLDKWLIFTMLFRI